MREKIAKYISKKVIMDNDRDRIGLQMLISNILLSLSQYSIELAKKTNVYSNIIFCKNKESSRYNRIYMRYKNSKYTVFIGCGFLIDFINIFYTKKIDYKYEELKINIDKSIVKFLGFFDKTEIYHLIIFIFIFTAYTHEFSHIFYRHGELKNELYKINEKYSSNYSIKDFEAMADALTGMMLTNVYWSLKFFYNNIHKKTCKNINSINYSLLFSAIMLIGIIVSIVFSELKKESHGNTTHPLPEDRIYLITNDFLMSFKKDADNRFFEKVITNFKACLLYFVPKYQQEFLSEEIDENGNIPEQSPYFHSHVSQKVDDAFAQRNIAYDLKEDSIRYFNELPSTPEA